MWISISAQLIDETFRHFNALEITSCGAFFFLKREMNTEDVLRQRGGR